MEQATKKKELKGNSNVKVRSLHFKHKVSCLYSPSVRTVTATFYINEDKGAVCCKIDPKFLIRTVEDISDWGRDKKKLFRLFKNFGTLNGISMSQFSFSDWEGNFDLISIEGKAYCDPGDTFNEYIGMQLAFKRAFNIYNKIHTGLLTMEISRLSSYMSDSITADKVDLYFERKINNPIHIQKECISGDVQLNLFPE